MGLYYVNDHLISEEIIGENVWAQNDNEGYKRIMLRTTPEAVRKLEDGTFTPVSKPLCVHNRSDVPGCNTRISSTIRNGDRGPKITVRTSSDTRYDTDVFVVALPYDGLIRSIQVGDNLAIFKMMLVKSDKFTIKCEDQNYRRAVYFVARPSHERLGNDGWFDNSCDLKVTFAQSNRPKTPKGAEVDESELSWTFKTLTVRFGQDGLFEISSESETAPYDSFSPDDVRDTKLCNTVTPINLDETDNNRGNGGGGNRGGGRRNDRDHDEDWGGNDRHGKGGRKGRR